MSGSRAGVVVVLLGLGACRPGASFNSPASDAGVPIASKVVQHTPQDLASVPERPLPVPDVVIGGGQQDSVNIPGIRGAALLPDGTVWVAAAMSGQVLRFSAEGRPLGALGGRGEGPGEFSRGPWGVYPCEDSVLVDEQWRYTLFTHGGVFQRVVVVPPPIRPLGPFTVGVSPDCSEVLVRVGEVPTPRQGTYRGLDVLAWMDPSTGTMDTVAATHGMDWTGQEVGGGLESMPLPFGSTSVRAQTGASVHVGVSAEPLMTLVDRAGDPVRTVWWDVSPRPVGRRDMEILEAERAAEIGRTPELAAILPPLGDYPIPSTAPVFASAVATDDGGLWVREYPDPSDGFGPAPDAAPDQTDRVLVFDARGRLEEIVLVPAGTRIHQIQGRRVLTSRVDEHGVPVVEVHQLPPA